MKRYQSAFAAPSGFVVSAGEAGKAGRRSEVGHRASDTKGLAPSPAKARPIRDIHHRAA